MCEQSHDHLHDHHHVHQAPFSPEERLALLTYMLSHNRHHAEELHDLAHGTEGEAARLLHDAVAAYESGNDKLAEALCLLKGA
ncbi:MAG: cobalt transporter [Ruminococcaceae bacterium]|nr:cobalt transporter [Oscillospiraceae bacterium]